jgi:hypothetical protein
LTCEINRKNYKLSLISLHSQSNWASLGWASAALLKSSFWRNTINKVCMNVFTLPAKFIWILLFAVAVLPMHASAASWIDIASVPGVRVADKAERARFVKQFASAQIAYNFDDANTRVLLHEGDLAVDGNLRSGDIVVVTGNLTVAGNYHDYQDGIGVLLVVGNMQVDNLYSWGALYVGRDLNAKGLVLTVYNDFTFEVAGKVNARALVVSDKSGEYTLGNTPAEISDNASKAKHAMALRTLLPEFFTNPDQLEREAGDAMSFDYLGFDDGRAEERIQESGKLFRDQLAGAELTADADLALAGDTPVETQLALLQRDLLLAQLVASNPELNTALHAPLLAINDATVNEWLAINAPDAALPKLDDSALTRAVAERLIANGKPSAEIIQRLAASKSPDVRGVLAGGPELAAVLANQLANDTDAGVRFHAVREQRYLLSRETIAARVTDSDVHVLDVLAHVPLEFAQTKALIPKLSSDGLVHLAQSLFTQATGAQPSLMNLEQQVEIAQILLKTVKLDDVKNVYLVLPEPQQLELFDALIEAQRIDVGHVAEYTRSTAIMRKVADLALNNAKAIPAALAKNPRLPLSLQRLIFEQGKASGVKADDDYDTHPIDTLAELLGQASMDQRLVDASVELAIARNELRDDSPGIQENLFARKLSVANLTRLDSKLRGTEDWSLTLLSQPHATVDQLRTALPRWYEDDAALQAELKALSAANGTEFFIALAKAKSPQLREVAARNAATPSKSLIALVADADPDVASAVRTNPNLPRAQRFAAAKTLSGSDVGYLNYFNFSTEELKALIAELPEAALKREARVLLAR